MGECKARAPVQPAGQAEGSHDQACIIFVTCMQPGLSLADLVIGYNDRLRRKKTFNSPSPYVRKYEGS